MSSTVGKFSHLFVRIWPSKLPKRTMIGDSEFSSFIFLDLETTGVRKPVEITELSMIAVERVHIMESCKTKSVPRFVDKFSTCVRPTKPIESYAAMLTWISDEDLERKKEFDIELGQIVKSFILRQPEPACLVAHNGDNFDFDILVSHLQAVGITLPETIHATDSLKAFQRQHKEIVGEVVNGKRKRFSCSLKNLYKTFVGGQIENAHSAEADAFALLRLVVHKPDILEYLENGAHQLCSQNKDNERNSKKPRVCLDEKAASLVQDEYFSQLEKEGLF